MKRSLRGPGLVGLVTAAAVAALACGQPVVDSVGPREPSGWDFRAQGVWRARAQGVGTARALAAGSRSAARPSLQGTLRLPVILLDFPDSPAPFAAAVYQEILFGPPPTGRPYSLSSYYAEISQGLLRVDGEVQEWITLPRSATYYGEHVAGPTGYSVRLGELLTHALQALDARGFDWASFDNDGPDDRPNSGDDDGVVDVAVFATAGISLVCPGGRDFVGHKNAVSAVTGEAFETSTPWAGHRGQALKVDDYTIQSAVGGASECDAQAPMSIGTVTHELGHGFGLPDLYDIHGPAGIGQWGLLGAGGLATPLSPARMEAWSLAELGWITERTVAADETVALAPIATSHEAIRIPLPGTDEYLLVENRQAQGTEAGHMDPAFRLEIPASMGPVGPGLLVWHVDEGQIAAQPQQFNRVTPHGLALIQADGRGDLERVPRTYRTNWGDAGDPYPGATGNRVLGPTSMPPLLDNQRAAVGITIDRISDPVPDGTITFRITFGR